MSTVVVTREHAEPGLVELRRRASGNTVVVQSNEAFAAYRVFGAPFFALVDGSGPRVATEGVALGPEQVRETAQRAKVTHPSGRL